MTDDLSDGLLPFNAMVLACKSEIKDVNRFLKLMTWHFIKSDLMGTSEKWEMILHFYCNRTLFSSGSNANRRLRYTRRRDSSIWSDWGWGLTCLFWKLNWFRHAQTLNLSRELKLTKVYVRLRYASFLQQVRCLWAIMRRISSHRGRSFFFVGEKWEEQECRINKKTIKLIAKQFL